MKKNSRFIRVISSLITISLLSACSSNSQGNTSTSSPSIQASKGETGTNEKKNIQEPTISTNKPFGGGSFSDHYVDDKNDRQNKRVSGFPVYEEGNTVYVFWKVFEINKGSSTYYMSKAIDGKWTIRDKVVLTLEGNDFGAIIGSNLYMVDYQKKEGLTRISFTEDGSIQSTTLIDPLVTIYKQNSGFDEINTSEGLGVLVSVTQN